MGRGKEAGSFRVPVQVKVSEEQEAMLARLVERGGFRNRADVVRLGLDIVALTEHGDAVVLQGPAARAVQSVGRDLGLDPDATMLAATYLLALVAQMAPKLEKDVEALVAQIKARVATAASAVPDRPVAAGGGRRPRSVARLPDSPGDP